MVRNYTILKQLLWLFFIPFYLFAAEDDVQVSAAIDTYKIFENYPLQGSLTITHLESQDVDSTSAALEGEPMRIELIKTVKISPQSSLILSIYRFELPGKVQGVYTLAPIQVKVGNRVYSSLPSTYEVTGIEIQANSEQAKGEIRLEATIKGTQPLYPKENASFVYRFLFRGNIELTAETLPLLEATGFRKLGAKRVQEYNEGGWSVQEITQDVEAIAPGTYRLPPSVVEGYAYISDPYGKRAYVQPKLKAEAPELTVTVKPFPAQNRPASFNGAVGDYTMEIKLLAPSTTISLGQKFQLALIFSGSGNLQDLPFPPISHYSVWGIKLGMENTPVGDIKNNQKTFLIDLRALSSEIEAIPSIEFSFFNLADKHYHTIRSEPIPIHVVKPQPVKNESSPTETLPQATEQTKKEVQLFVQPKPLKLPVPSVLKWDLTAVPFGTWFILWAIPLGVLLIAFQMLFKRYRNSSTLQQTPLKSDELFEKALQAEKGPVRFQLLRQAFLTQLVSMHLIKKIPTTLEELPAEGLVGEVRLFLLRLEQERFSGQMVDDSLLLKEAEMLWKRFQTQND